MRGSRRRPVCTLAPALFLALLGCGSSSPAPHTAPPREPPAREAAVAPSGTDVASGSRPRRRVLMSLRRPLRFRPGRSGEPCRPTGGRTSGRLDAPVGRSRAVLPGSGPAYPVISTAPGRYDPDSEGPSGVAAVGPDSDGARYQLKILWGVSPTYAGPVLVRGALLDAAGDVGWGESGPPKAELLFGPGRAGRWRTVPTRMRMTEVGCVALQVDTTDGSSVIVFRARPAH